MAESTMDVPMKIVEKVETVAQDSPIEPIVDASEKSPLILSNELLVAEAATATVAAPIAANETDEKMDELTSLERAIAEMHHVDEPPPPTSEMTEIDAASTVDGADGDENLPLELQAIVAAVSRNSTPASRDSPGNNSYNNNGVDSIDAALEVAAVEQPLEHDDLLAVLKGIDHSGTEPEEEAEPKPTRASSAAGSMEGVTIEGEGQFQIMDVIDDEGEEEEEKPTQVTTTETVANKNTAAAVSPSYKSTAPKLTREEVHAIAMEQIGGLRAHQKKQRARKQDIKPLPIEADEVEGGGDLVSQLGADWSDDEATVEQATITPPTLSAAASVVSETTSSSASAPVEPRVESVKVAVTSAAGTVAAAPMEPKQRRKTPPKITSVVVLQSGNSNKVSSTVSSKSSSSAADAGSVKEPEVGLLTNTSTTAQPPVITGFKRTRIIKRKIIWDPDAPETTFSYAQLVRGGTTKSAASTKPEPTSTVPKSFGVNTTAPTSSTSTAAANKKESPVKKLRPVTPKSTIPVEKKVPPPSSAKSLTVTEKKTPRAATPKAATTAANKAVTAPTTTQATKATDEAGNAARVSSPAKRRSQTPVANGSVGAGGKKKKYTELDRLMGDEGAVNMLNSLESELGKIAVEAVADDKPHKPLMRSRAATISERIIKRATTPTPAAATTKKETAAATPVTAKNKRGGANKPKASASWDYVYKQQASDDSMIIRRRSNSSYSSNASAPRSSLDGPGAATTPKPTKSTSAAANSTSTSAAAVTNSANNSATSKSPTKASSKTPKQDTTLSSDISLKSSGSSGGSRDNTPNTSGAGKTFEFAKPVSKSNQKSNRRTKSPSSATQNPLTSDMKKATTSSASGRRAARSPATVDEKEKKETKSETVAASSAVAASQSSAAVSDVVVKKTGKVAQVVFNTHRAKLEYSFTAQMMNKLVDILDQLSADANCHVVVILTNAPHFCHGIDCTDLTVGSAEKRRTHAVNLATAVKNYLKTLATFPKPLIAGVNGRNIGLGVTQLPLFDIVVASDKGSYETPYAKLGQVPEGYCIWNNITKIRGTFKTKLFWLCEKLHSTESALSGLVNKLTSSDKVNEDAFSTAKKIAAMSPESYRVMKQTTIHNHLDAIITALDEEFDTIITQWTSTECQENFKKYLENGQL